jgi:hypothetical protein
VIRTFLGVKFHKLATKRRPTKDFPRKNPSNWPHFKEKIVEMIVFELDVLGRH